MLPEQNNFSMFPIPECQFIHTEMARGGFPRPPAFKPLSHESLMKGAGVRQRVVTEEVNDGREAIYFRDRSAFFPLNE